MAVRTFLVSGDNPLDTSLCVSASVSSSWTSSSNGSQNVKCAVVYDNTVKKSISVTFSTFSGVKKTSTANTNGGNGTMSISTLFTNVGSATYVFVSEIKVVAENGYTYRAQGSLTYPINTGSLYASITLTHTYS